MDSSNILQALADGLPKLVVDSIPDYAILTLDPDRAVTSWNAGAEATFGWTEEEMLGRSGDIIFLPEDIERGAPEMEAKTAVTAGRAPDERFHLHKDGSRFYVSGVMTPVLDQEDKLAGFVKIARDMTKRIASEKVKLDRESLRQILLAQEDERARIARDLHDDVGQQLTLLRLRLDMLKEREEDADTLTEILGVCTIAQTLDARVDRIAWELRPQTLDDLGLVPALDKYISEWCKHVEIKCSFNAPRLRKTRFLPDVETNLYRIVQEGLNNIVKHAKAKNVEITFERLDGMLVLTVTDDGKGVRLKKEQKISKGIGMMGMRERAILIGGSLDIESRRGEGTTVRVSVPVKSALLQK